MLDIQEANYELCSELCSPDGSCKWEATADKQTLCMFARAKGSHISYGDGGATPQQTRLIAIPSAAETRLNQLLRKIDNVWRIMY